MHKRQLLTIVGLLGILFISSCGSFGTLQKRTIYFRSNEPTDSSVYITKIPPYIPSIVQPDDILAVKITSISDFTEKSPVSIFNDGGIEYVLVPSINNGSNGGGGGGNANLKGYLVDGDGLIDYPVIGKMKVAGLTVRQIKTMISEKLAANYIKDPVVEVRIINYKVTVLGEVRYPGVVIAPNHRMNVMEAVAAAGDISLSGRRDNIMVIRENHGQREFARINLSSRNSFTNPYFYLKQNDILYVEASKVVRQETHNNFTRFYLPTITSSLTSLVAIYAIFLFKK